MCPGVPACLQPVFACVRVYPNVAACTGCIRVYQCAWMCPLVCGCAGVCQDARMCVGDVPGCLELAQYICACTRVWMYLSVRGCSWVCPRAPSVWMCLSVSGCVCMCLGVLGCVDVRECAWVFLSTWVCPFMCVGCVDVPGCAGVPGCV